MDWRLPGNYGALWQIGQDLRLPGFEHAKLAGKKPTPDQVTRDIILLVEVMKVREEKKDDVVAYRRIIKRRRARGEPVNEDDQKAQGALRKRTNFLTNPKSDRDRRAALRMFSMIAKLSSVE